MKFLILATIFLSIDAHQAQPGKLKTENSGEETTEMKWKIARLETNMADLQQSMRAILSLLNHVGKMSEGLVVPESAPEKQSAEYLEENVSMVTGGKSDSRKMNDTDLEQRVQILEFQMINVIDDVTTLTDDVTDLEDDVGTKLTLFEADITLIQVDQNTQDGRINELVDVVVIHDTRLENLESLNLAEELDDLDSRLDKHEISGIIAFHAVHRTESPVPEQTPVIFDGVYFNYGSGYNRLTGEFTTPPGGAGLYYFYFHFEGLYLESADLALRKNIIIPICDAINGRIDTNDSGTVGCGAVVHLNEGDIVNVINNYSTNDLPATGVVASTTFSGFRIAPE